MAGSSDSIGQVKDALSAVANTGKFTGDQLGMAAQAALDMSNLTGQSVDQAVAAISRLADDPVKAIQALDEQYHFLSTATLQHIQQLQDEGDAQGAAILAEQT
jgi:phage-related minor tail protein